MSDPVLYRLQRLMLAHLEEAGAEWPATLLVTTIECSGRPIEAQVFAKAVRELVDAGLCVLSVGEVSEARLMDCGDSVSLARALVNDLRWSDGGWWWSRQSKDAAGIKLTDRGIEEAQRVLEQDGFPTGRVSLPG